MRLEGAAGDYFVQALALNSMSQISQTSPHMTDAPILHQSSRPFPGLTLICPCLSHVWQPRTRHSTHIISPVPSPRDRSPPSAAGDALPNAALGAVGHLCHRSTFLATTNNIIGAPVQKGAKPFAALQRSHKQKPTEWRKELWREAAAQGVVSQAETS